MPNPHIRRRPLRLSCHPERWFVPAV